MKNNTMKIGAWIAPPHFGDKNFIDDGQFRRLKESGINTIYSLYERLPEDEEDVLKTLGLCEKYGIGYLVIDDDFSLKGNGTGVNAHIYENRSAFVGILVCDEPGAEHFDKLKQLKKSFDATFRDKLFYVNTLPSYSQPEQLLSGAARWREDGSPAGERAYLDYVDGYFEKVSPEVFSLDYYPMEGDFPNIKDGYFRQLSLARAYTARRNIPFWVFIQTCSWSASSRVPKKSEVFWQVSTALAYGARGIQYFTYFLPLEVSAGSGDVSFTGSMIDADGQKTELYDIVRLCNAHLHKAAPILMESEFRGVQVFGECPIEVPACDLASGGVESLSGGSFLCGSFTRAGQSAFYIVNLSLTETSRAAATLSEEREYVLLRKARKRKFSGRSFSAVLGPGEGILVY